LFFSSTIVFKKPLVLPLIIALGMLAASNFATLKSYPFSVASLWRKPGQKCATGEVALRWMC